MKSPEKISEAVKSESQESLKKSLDYTRRTYSSALDFLLNAKTSIFGEYTLVYIPGQGYVRGIAKPGWLTYVRYLRSSGLPKISGGVR